MLSVSHGGFVLWGGVALAAATACVRPSSAPAATAAPSLQCDRGYAVTVANNTTVEVDIWQSRDSEWVYVGSVPARTTSELALEGGGTVEWRWPPKPVQYDPNLSSEVTLRVHCTV